MINFEQAKALVEQTKQRCKEFAEIHKCERLYEAEQYIKNAIEERQSIAYFGDAWAIEEKYLCAEELAALGFTARVDSYYPRGIICELPV